MTQANGAYKPRGSKRRKCEQASHNGLMHFAEGGNPPPGQGKLSKPNILKSSLVACFVLGPNPPVQGYRRTVAKPDRVFIVRFHLVLKRDATLKNSCVYFDKKKTPNYLSMVLGQTMNKNDLARILIWITFPELNFKYWSKEGLNKIGSLIRKPIATDKAAQAKLRTKFVGL
ncbi:hypothetical protein Cgig2_012692 [Carnegiea gigantea]|uniref:DUF4283 domain-containing protein n=1 Tax=Carnegiea gigantea TaxID=171969 RepID=A0A9Q1JZJ0_9CARY|nr:hypothetical protein Cgig2_012692 [Carnegiea gigantea]